MKFTQFAQFPRFSRGFAAVFALFLALCTTLFTVPAQASPMTTLKAEIPFDECVGGGCLSFFTTTLVGESNAQFETVEVLPFIVHGETTSLLAYYIFEPFIGSVLIAFTSLVPPDKVGDNIYQGMGYACGTDTCLPGFTVRTEVLVPAMAPLNFLIAIIAAPVSFDGVSSSFSAVLSDSGSLGGPPAEPDAVPEPGTLALVGVTGIALMATRRRRPVV